MANNMLVVAIVVFWGAVGVVAAQEVPKASTQKPVVADSVIRVDLVAQSPRPKTNAKTQPTAAIDLAAGPIPNWLWRQPASPAGERVTFFKEFQATSSQAQLITACDNHVTLLVNGKQVAKSDDWNQPALVDLQPYLKPGKNLIKANCANDSGPAAFICKIGFKDNEGKTQYIVSDASWKCSHTAKAADATAPVVIAAYGAGPWGKVFESKPAALTAAVPRNVFQLLDGFQVEEMYTVPKNEQGSWVAITFDDKGRLIASDQGNKGLYRITLPKIGSDAATRVERLNVKMTSAHGLLYAFDSLYVSVNGGPGSGFYRLRDTNGDDQFDEVKKLKSLRGGGEHGPHSLRLSKDGKSIYVIAGNHTDLPAELSGSRIPTNWSEDLLLPRQWDARGHAKGKLAPGGWIAKTDPDGKTWEIVSVGYRNSFDFALNVDGEIFAYDADMEWDFGAPWYRPTRVVHATSGSEFGWRSGTGKWPAYYADSLPQAVDIGPGSPVGVEFGYGTKFPAKYQNALYCLDWTFGTIYAVHFKAEGASYRATKEEFLSRSPLPLTDAAVGPDGALYFTIGGRGTQSALFRVTYVGKQSTAPAVSPDRDFLVARLSRRSLEAFHGLVDSRAIEAALPQLANRDRHIRYAARLALEFQPLESWASLVLDLKDETALIHGIIAIARQGNSELQRPALDRLLGLDPSKLTRGQKLDLIRAYSLLFVRQGTPNNQIRHQVLKQLDGLFPAKDMALDRELCNILVYLNSPTVVDKTLKLMQQQEVSKGDAVTDLLSRNPSYGGTVASSLTNRPEVQKMHYALALRNLRYGWTLDQRREYLLWFVAASKKSGGASYQGFLGNIRKEALANMSEAERLALDDHELRPQPKDEDLPKAKGPGQAWSVDQLVEVAGSGLRKRNFENGKKMYAAAKCASCHRFGGQGGATGPDLSNVAGRFSLKDLAEALILPSKVVSDQYQAMLIATADGKVITGRVINDDGKKITVMTDPVDPTKTAEIQKDDIDEMRPAKTSLMPDKLLNELNQQELLDLLAYLMSRGNPNAIEFQ